MPPPTNPALTLKKYCKWTPEGCWEWTRCKSEGGYGRIAVGGEVYRCHHVSFRLFIGAIPKGFIVCHLCDNPPCCNPEHLWIGTIQDNNKDRDKKGRVAHGDSHSNAKLSTKQVKLIRALREGGATQPSLAKKFNVSTTNIQDILHRRSWKHV